MQIQKITIHIETENDSIQVVFVGEKSIAKIMGSGNDLGDLILDIINNENST